MAIGRTTESRTITVGTTNTDATITGAAGTFHEEDAGRTITGTGIPAGTTIASVTSATAAEMSAVATATGSPSVTLGSGSGLSYGFIGWSPETDAESETYPIAAGAGASAPSVLANDHTRLEQRSRE